jgi:hypothetical protein
MGYSMFFECTYTAKNPFSFGSWWAGDFGIAVKDFGSNMEARLGVWVCC